MATTSADTNGYSGDGEGDLGTRDDTVLTYMFGASPLPDVADNTLVASGKAGWYTSDAVENAAVAALSGKGVCTLDSRTDFDLGTESGVIDDASSYWSFDGGTFTLKYSNYSNGTISDISVKGVVDPDGNEETKEGYSIAGTGATTDEVDGVIEPSPYHPTTATGNMASTDGDFPALPASTPRTPHTSQWGSVTNSAGNWDVHYDDKMNPLDPKDSSAIIDAKDFTTINMGTST